MYFVKITSICIIVILGIGCVPAKKMEALQTSYNNLQAQYDELNTLKVFGDSNYNELQRKYAELDKNYNGCVLSYDRQALEVEKLKEQYAALNQNYEKLLKNNAETSSSLQLELAKLSKELDAKEREIFAKETNVIAQERENEALKKELDGLEQSLLEREKVVNDLQARLAMQEKSLGDLKKKLTNSLIGYQNSGISVVEKSGKIYVSLDNSLLFPSGKTSVDAKGKQALLSIAESLKDLEGFDIMVEGHTDNVPISTSAIQDNWDLSVLRATSVVRYLTNEGGVNPLKIIPSGRSEYVPVDPSNTKEAKAKNRRIEIILSPKLDQLLEIVK
jgi:chemotaxis protein MotB